MLHSRFPLYAHKARAFSTSDQQFEASKKSNFYKMYRARREAFSYLETARKYREQRSYEPLIKLTEDALSNFFQPVSNRVFPRKFEFITEMCNNFALAFCEELQIPHNLMKINEKLQMFKLFAVPIMPDRFQDVPYEFGKIETYRDPEKVDTSFIEYK